MNWTFLQYSIAIVLNIIKFIKKYCIFHLKNCPARKKSTGRNAESKDGECSAPFPAPHPVKLNFHSLYENVSASSSLCRRLPAGSVALNVHLQTAGKRASAPPVPEILRKGGESAHEAECGKRQETSLVSCGAYLGNFSEKHLEIGKDPHTLQARMGAVVSTVVFSVVGKALP